MSTELLSKSKKQQSLAESQMGVGYSSDRGMVTGMKCLKNYQISVIGKPESTVLFTNSRSGSDVSKDFGLGIAGSVPIFPMVTGGASIRYDQYSKEDKYSESFNFLYRVALGSEILQVADYGKGALNAFGLAAYQAGAKQFKLSCGDKFVVQESLGMRLYVTMKLIFASTVDKMALNLGLSGQLDLIALMIEIKVNLRAKIENENTNLHLEIAAYQEGGYVEKLTNIFGKGDDVMSCDVKDTKSFENCEAIIQGIVNYAKGSFKDQVEYIKDGEIEGYPAIIGNVYMDYAQIGLGVSDYFWSTIGNSTAVFRNEKIVEYSKLAKAREYVENLLYNSKFYNISGSGTEELNNQLRYKKFDVDFIALNKWVGNTKGVMYGSWTWTPDAILVEMKLSLGMLLDNINKNIFILESKDYGIRQCYENANGCSNIKIDDKIDYSALEWFKSAFKVISICNGDGYGRYVLPIGANIYQENAKFELSADKIIYSSIKYIIEKKDSSKLSVYILKDSLRQQDNRKYCGDIDKHGSQDDPIFVYKGEFRDTCPEICPNASLDGSLLPIDVFFIETMSPI